MGVILLSAAATGKASAQLRAIRAVAKAAPAVRIKGVLFRLISNLMTFPLILLFVIGRRRTQVIDDNSSHRLRFFIGMAGSHDNATINLRATKEVVGRLRLVSRHYFLHVKLLSYKDLNTKRFRRSSGLIRL
ncbi:hypothetical protein ABENE_16970 [Asticcacaulis benevestitus DSM 16100 = ATCC BAA-896]|uniref:Uncharacterized protein n=1 Tax=Asticcacaulis benevestitus DSM 16100 = ATCC BAA-896 TaxID=1121022 RepID=V4R8K0_9CAUL|nr:hypothetical protein ABENE_16970 [Asticcacaulis benevestitus DSM 16100 = ATCC BAA-896]